MTYATEWSKGDAYRYQFDEHFFAIGVVMEVSAYKNGDTFIVGREIRVYTEEPDYVTANTIDLDATHQTGPQLIHLGSARQQPKPVLVA